MDGINTTINQLQSDTLKRYKKLNLLIKILYFFIGATKNETAPLEKERFFEYFERVLGTSGIQVEILSIPIIKASIPTIFYCNHPGGLDSIIASYAILKTNLVTPDKIFTVSFEMSVPFLPKQIAEQTIPVIIPPEEIRKSNKKDHGIVKFVKGLLLNKIYNPMSLETINSYNDISQSVIQDLLMNNKSILIFPEGGNQMLDSENIKWFKGIAKAIWESDANIQLVPLHISHKLTHNSAYFLRLKNRFHLTPKKSISLARFGTISYSNLLKQKATTQKDQITFIRDILQADYNKMFNYQNT